MNALLIRVLVLSSLLLFTLPASAQIAVMVPGYQGNGDDFRSSGVTAQLRESGFGDAGRALAGPYGPRFQRPAVSGERQFYTLSLPTDQPIPWQARWLETAVEAITTRHPEQELVLVGHSAGGVVARFLLVTGEMDVVNMLVTISSPHSGSELSELGRSVGQALGATPMGMATPFLGLDDLQRSQGLLSDLERPRPGNLLAWLNMQPHPEIRYVSIIRPGDRIVAPTSQDMNGVPALAGRSAVREIDGGHSLDPAIGRVLVEMFVEP
jgi:pimeloyl-ACP methyl ester carboxylesterase